MKFLKKLVHKFMNKDYITYAKYSIIKNKSGKIIDLEFSFANDRLKTLLGMDPTHMYRSKIMPINAKMCQDVQNVIDIGIAKHFSYTDKKFGYIEGIIENDLSDQNKINIYSIDIDQLRKDNSNIKHKISTILSMFNITLLHWNAKEHYVYSDNILTTDFKEENPDLYVGNNVRCSYDLYKIVDNYQRKKIEEQLELLKNKELAFLNFNLVVKNSINEDVNIRVIILPDDKENMYIIGIEY